MVLALMATHPAGTLTRSIHYAAKLLGVLGQIPAPVVPSGLLQSGRMMSADSSIHVFHIQYPEFVSHAGGLLSETTR
jgi:hypothetical protein